MALNLTQTIITRYFNVKEGLYWCQECVPERVIRIHASTKSNILTHFRGQHPELYENILKLVSSTSSLTNVELFKDHDSSDIVNQFTDVILKNNLTLNLFENPTLKSLLTLFSPTLKVPYKKQIMDCLENKFLLVESFLKTQLAKSNFISIGFDIWGFKAYSILALNTRYNDGDRIVDRTFDFLTFENHTSETLKTKVLDTINKYEINTLNIVSICTDNARNMISSVKKLNQILNLDIEINEEDDIDNMEVGTSPKNFIITNDDISYI